jgi:gamma-glutamyltranspeptidase/glutathione hydrolase
MARRAARPRGVVAAGHPLTAEAARIILEAGGNAFDAIVAAGWAACVGEPVLTSPGGGGFMLGRAASSGTDKAVLMDFFTQTPLQRRSSDELDFFPIQADFGTTTQEFHIGLGSVATPGMVAGLFRIQRELGRLPMTRLVEPAVHWARQGCELSALQAYIFEVVRPIYEFSPESQALFRSRCADGLLQAGERFTLPALADTLEVLAIEGDALFYRGELAAMIARQSRDGGGHLSRADLEAYRVQLRAPMVSHFGGARLLFNPPPSSGGPLIALSLALWQRHAAGRPAWGSSAAMTALAEVMQATNQVREQLYDPQAHQSGIAAQLLSDPVISAALKSLRGESLHTRGTSHISVMDGDGNVAALTCSNGEGCGYMLPGSGIMLNNMLGEEDLNRDGFHQWQTDRRLSSMMAPTLVEHRDYTIATGSGGSNRIRSAILQVLIQLIEYGWEVEQAVNSPRIHLEGRHLSMEPGFDVEVVQALERGWPGAEQWQHSNLFFGGAHTLMHHHRDDRFSGAGDHRRGGVFLRLGS